MCVLFYMTLCVCVCVCVPCYMMCVFVCAGVVKCSVWHWFDVWCDIVCLWDVLCDTGLMCYVTLCVYEMVHVTVCVCMFHVWLHVCMMHCVCVCGGVIQNLYLMNMLIAIVLRAIARYTGSFTLPLRKKSEHVFKQKPLNINHGWDYAAELAPLTTWANGETYRKWRKSIGRIENTKNRGGGRNSQDYTQMKWHL